ncbi:MAG: serine/threonine protein kinase [Labilithrix sp.]|nr:serine/threonine protein kinase [Labilithrix sp.]MCW5831098.1 serine/threonine protein kinase [Labilithrix sp.]
MGSHGALRDVSRARATGLRSTGSGEPPQAGRAMVLAGRYALRAELGRGGCAVVYEAHDLRLGRLVALKMVKSNARDAQANARLAREARAAAAIHHPNVCGLSDAGYLEDGRPYLVMERLHGETLTHCLHRLGRLSATDAIDIALQLLSALDAAHALGVVHRDVKPDNVFLVPRNGCGPLVKLLDFGMCRRATPMLRDDATLTRAGQVVGTPEYMSPEQVSGKRNFDARIDLYAVGVILYEALSGQRAFPGKDAREVVVSVLVRALPPLRSICPDVPPVLDRIVARAMERDASFRYSSAAEFQGDLLEAKAALNARRLRGIQTGRHPVDHGHARQQPHEGEWEEPTRQLRPSRRSA